MEIAVKKFSNAMCLKAPQPYENAVMRVVDGRINKKWNCIVARWSSINCLKLAKSAQKLGWTVKPDEHFLEAIGPLSNRLEMPGFMTYQEIRQKSLASFQNVQDNVMKTRLWNHQKEAFVELHGLTGAILDMGMGTGKTATSISLIMAGKHDFGIIICPKSVVPVWPMELDKHCAKKIMTYTGPKRKTSTIKQFTKDLIAKKEIADALKEPFFLITNYEKMWQRELGEYLLGLKDIDFVVYDECVPAGTKIATPTGECCIESLNIGDVIYGYDDEKNEIVETKVCHCFNRRTKEPLYSIAKTQMTGNHPVWTDNRGYIRADQLSTLDTLGHIGLKVVNGDDKNHLRMVWGGEGNSEEEEIGFTPFLLKKMLCEMEVHTTRAEAVGATFGGNKRVDQGCGKKANGLSRIPGKGQTVCEFGEKSVQKPRKKPSYARKGDPCVKGDRVQPSRRRQRVWADNSAKDIGGNAWVENRSSYLLRKRLKKARITDALFCRYSKRHSYDRNRNRRAISFSKIGQIKRREEGRFSIFNWLEGRSFLKQGSLGRCREVRKNHIGDSEEKLVYNIETGTGNYFANGLLVHNCHRLKTPSGSASKMAAKLRNNARRVLGCTGTLLPHSPMDAFGIFRAVDPAVFGTINMLFRNEYAVIGGFEGKQIVGFKNQDKMHDMIQTISYRVKSEDVLDLPPFQHIVRHCELDTKTRKLYNEMHDDLCVEHEGHTLTAANALVKILRLQQITSGISTDMYGEEIMLCKDGDLPEKATLLADVLDDFAENEPLVVFCRFTADITAVRKVAERQGRQYFELSGKKNELAEWQDNKQGILAVQIRAGKEGVDFTISCTQIYYSIGHSLGDYEQSLKRTHRPGQTRPVVYIHLVAKDTIDEEVYESLDKKRDIVQHVLDNIQPKQ